jgi:hypothetical protein
MLVSRDVRISNRGTKDVALLFWTFHNNMSEIVTDPGQDRELFLAGEEARGLA